jgi:hypothetical protein
MRNFGIEIEALLPSGLGINPGVRREAVAAAIRAEGIDARSEGYNHRTRTYWKVITDQTIGHEFGVEVVSPILDIDADGLDKVAAVSRALIRVNAQVRRSCGLHVHHDMRGQNFRTWQMATKLFLKFESAMDKLVPPSRRAGVNQYCKSNTESMGGDIKDAFKKIDACNNLNQLRSLQHTQPHLRRYHKLNLEAVTTHNTIEFRGHGGTVEFKKMEAWILLTSSIVEDAKERGNNPAYFVRHSAPEKAFDLMLAGLKGDDVRIRRALRRRRAALGT